MKSDSELASLVLRFIKIFLHVNFLNGKKDVNKVMREVPF